jgi:hypothetical protein
VAKRLVLCAAFALAAATPAVVEARELCENGAACWGDEAPATSPTPAPALVSLDVDCSDDVFDNAVGICDVPGAAPVVAPSASAPTRTPLSCEGDSCRPQHAPLAADAPLSPFSQPVALLGCTQDLLQAQGALFSHERACPGSWNRPRVDRPPRR